MSKITIIGAGVSSLVLARCLLQKGIRATIFEKAKNSSSRNGYGITLHANAYKPLLRSLGLDERAFVSEVAVDAAVGGTGRVRQRERRQQQWDGEVVEGALRVNRGRFERVLAEGLEVRWEREVVGLEYGNGIDGDGDRDGGGIRVRFTDGEEMQSRIVVGADGPHSCVRESAITSGGAEVRVLPFAVYNGRRRLSAREFEDGEIGKVLQGGDVLQERVEDAVFRISINDRDAESVNLSYTYSRPAREGQDALFRPGRPKSGAAEIPEELFGEIADLQHRLSGPFARFFDGEAMRRDRLLNWLMRSVRVEAGVCGQAAKRGIVLIGDAVHAEPILGGYGANEAIVDGMRLAELLSGNEVGGCSAFIDLRAKDWRTGVEESEDRIWSMHNMTKPSL